MIHVPRSEIHHPPGSSGGEFFNFLKRSQAAQRTPPPPLSLSLSLSLLALSTSTAINPEISQKVLSVSQHSPPSVLGAFVLTA